MARVAVAVIVVAVVIPSSLSFVFWRGIIINNVDDYDVDWLECDARVA